MITEEVEVAIQEAGNNKRAPAIFSVLEKQRRHLAAQTLLPSSFHSPRDGSVKSRAPAGGRGDGCGTLEPKGRGGLAACTPPQPTAKTQRR